MKKKSISNSTLSLRQAKESSEANQDFRDFGFSPEWIRKWIFLMLDSYRVKIIFWSLALNFNRPSSGAKVCKKILFFLGYHSLEELSKRYGAKLFRLEYERKKASEIDPCGKISFRLIWIFARNPEIPKTGGLYGSWKKYEQQMDTLLIEPKTAWHEFNPNQWKSKNKILLPR